MKHEALDIPCRARNSKRVTGRGGRKGRGPAFPHTKGASLSCNTLSVLQNPSYLEPSKPPMQRHLASRSSCFRFPCLPSAKNSTMNTPLSLTKSPSLGISLLFLAGFQSSAPGPRDAKIVSATYCPLGGTAFLNHRRVKWVKAANCNTTKRAGAKN